MSLTGATRGAVYVFVPGTAAVTSLNASSSGSGERYRADYLLCVGAINPGNVIQTSNIPIAAGTTMGAVVHHSVGANLCGTSYAHEMDDVAMSILNSRETAELQRAASEIDSGRPSAVLRSISKAQEAVQERYNTQLKVRNALIFPFGEPSSGAEASSTAHLRQALGCVLLADKPEALGSVQSAVRRRSVHASNLPTITPSAPSGSPRMRNSGRILQRAAEENENSRVQLLSTKRQDHWAREGNGATRDAPFAVSVANAFNKAEQEKLSVSQPRRSHYRPSAPEPQSSPRSQTVSHAKREATVSSTREEGENAATTATASPFEPLDETYLWCTTTLLQPVFQRYPSHCWVSDEPFTFGTSQLLPEVGSSLASLSVVPPIAPFDPNVLFLKEVLTNRLMARLEMEASTSASRRRSSVSTRKLSLASTVLDTTPKPPMDGPTAKAASETAVLIKRPPRQLQKTVVMRLKSGSTALRSKDVVASMAKFTGSIDADPAGGADGGTPGQEQKKGDIHHVLDRLHPTAEAGLVTDPSDTLLEVAPQVTAMEVLWRKSLEHITALRSDLESATNVIKTRERTIFDLEGEVQRMTQYYARLRADITKIKRAVPEHLAAKFDLSDALGVDSPDLDVRNAASLS